MQNEILWTSGFFNERFPAPVSPLGWSLLGPLIEELALRDPLRFLGYSHAESIPLTRLWRGHPYANVLVFQIFYKAFPDSILPEDCYRYFPNGDVGLRTLAPYPRWIDAPRFVFSLARAFFFDPFNVSPLTNYRHWARYTREHDRRVAALRDRLGDLAHAEPHEILAALGDTEKIHRAFLKIHRWSLIDADLTLGLLKRLVGSGEIAARLVVDVPNKTLEVDADLRRLLLADFFVKHGHRSFSLDIAVPTFAEQPQQVARLKSMTADHRPPTTSSSVGSQPSAVVLPILSLARQYVAMREDQRYYWQKALAVSRHLYLLLADRLVADQVMADRNDVFNATHSELVDYFEGKLHKTRLSQTIRARQTEWNEYFGEFMRASTESYPAFLRGDTPLQNALTTQATVRQWQGRAISPGLAHGTARVVHSSDELASVQPGEILVAPATDPAWTPVFVRIAGLIVERGGVLSHSAVVAREYNVPGVAAIPNIVAEIHNGDLIEIDGSAGLVRCIKPLGRAGCSPLRFNPI